MKILVVGATGKIGGVVEALKHGPKDPVIPRADTPGRMTTGEETAGTTTPLRSPHMIALRRASLSGGRHE